LLVTEGQAVQKGQLLAQLDAEIIQRGLDEVTTQLEFAQVIYDKQQRIYQQKAGSEIQYLQAKNNKESLEKRLASLKEQLELTKIKAPTSGFVDGLKPTNGEMVMAGMPMMTIVNTSDMRVIADLSESYVSTVGNGDPAQISFPEIGETLRTKVGTVSKSVNPVNRTFRVEIPIRPVPAGLRPNTTCDLQINDNTVPNAIAVPLEAVVREDNRTYAYVLKDNVAQRRAIETGLVSGASVQILNGIQAREQVVVRGATTLADGQRVRIIE
jgi:RND family efflux transporter MFP subunit